MVNSTSTSSSTISCPICDAKVQVESGSPFPQARCQPCQLLLWRSNTFDAVVPLFDFQSLPEDLSNYVIDREFDAVHNAFELVPESAARDLRVLPVFELPDGLILAVGGDLNRESFEKLRFVLGREVFVVPVDDSWIDRKIRDVYGRDDDD